MNILFVTWDGPQVSYLESLFLPIFSGLRPHGIHFDVLQFRWGDEGSGNRAEQACDSAGIGYRAIPVWRWGGGAGPLASAFYGAIHVRRAVRRFGSDVLMPRSLMPAIAVLAAGGSKLRPIVFDADGLAADERVDVAGLSSLSITYRLLRDVEAQTVRLSTSVITRTRPSADILYHRAGPPVSMDAFTVVTNGRDEAVFHPSDAQTRAAVRSELNIDEAAPLLVYAGSVGPQYRMDAVKALFLEVQRLRSDARLLIMTGSPERVQPLFGELPGVVSMRAAPGEVPRYLAAADAGLAYRSTIYSMLGVAPVKVSEYLLCGLPVIGTAAIGEMSAINEEGLFFNDESGSASGAEWLVREVLPRRDEFRARTRAAGQSQFSLARSISDYERALRPLSAHVSNR